MKTEAELRTLYDHPKGRSLEKQLPHLEKHSINFLAHSPFCVISTSDQNGNLDSSPRGGAPGFVKPRSLDQIIIPDSKGNNRLDSMKNILDTGKVGTLFFIPGIDETLRINGRAKISTEPEDLDVFTGQSGFVKSCIVVSVDEVFLHCAKALMRSRLWSVESQIPRSDFPTMGEMLNEQLNLEGEPEPQDQMVKRYTKDL